MFGETLDLLLIQICTFWIIKRSFLYYSLFRWQHLFIINVTFSKQNINSYTYNLLIANPSSIWTYLCTFLWNNHKQNMHFVMSLSLLNIDFYIMIKIIILSLKLFLIMLILMKAYAEQILQIQFILKYLTNTQICKYEQVWTYKI